MRSGKTSLINNGLLPVIFVRRQHPLDTKSCGEKTQVLNLKALQFISKNRVQFGLKTYSQYRLRAVLPSFLCHAFCLHKPDCTLLSLCPEVRANFRFHSFPSVLGTPLWAGNSCVCLSRSILAGRASYGERRHIVWRLIFSVKEHCEI